MIHIGDLDSQVHRGGVFSTFILVVVHPRVVADSPGRETARKADPIIDRFAR